MPGICDAYKNKKHPDFTKRFCKIIERETRLELATLTLARLCSTN